jgi:glutamate/tyrosine decarboxylase-like PLP-dependent enzyme
MGEMIKRGFVLAEKAEQELRKKKDWEIVSAASLAILTFRFRPENYAEAELGVLNSSISRRLFSENVAGIVTTVVRGLVVLRICAINPWLSEEDMAKVIVQMDLVARAVLEETGPE